MAEQRPQIPYFKEFLPTLVCIVLSLFFAMVFQFNGGVFLPAATQMSSALGCIQEDVTMAGYASFIGMLMVVWICVMCLTRTIKLGKKIPLYGIDWIGLLLWTVMLFAIVFICIYGDFYDWLERADSLLHCNSRSILVDKHQPDDFHTASVYRPAGIPLQEIPRSIVPVLDALSVSHHLLRTAECIHDLHLTVRYAKCHFIELVCICRNPGWSRYRILPASSIKGRI